jgi:hypothetical protein
MQTRDDFFLTLRHFLRFGVVAASHSIKDRLIKGKIDGYSPKTRTIGDQNSFMAPNCVGRHLHVLESAAVGATSTTTAAVDEMHC